MTTTTPWYAIDWTKPSRRQLQRLRKFRDNFEPRRPLIEYLSRTLPEEHPAYASVMSAATLAAAGVFYGELMPEIFFALGLTGARDVNTCRKSARC